jgi:hypothetical protein
VCVNGSIEGRTTQNLSVIYNRVAHFDYIRCSAVDNKMGVMVTGSGDGSVRAWIVKASTQPFPGPS